MIPDSPALFTEGGTGCIITGKYEAGVGRYRQVYRVQIERITPTQIKVRGQRYCNGTVQVFNRQTLIRRGETETTGDRLYESGAPEVQAARREVQTANTLHGVCKQVADTVDLMRRDSSQAHVALDVTGTIERTIANLDTLIKDAINARNALCDLKDYRNTDAA